MYLIFEKKVTGEREHINMEIDSKKINKKHCNILVYYYSIQHWLYLSSTFDMNHRHNDLFVLDICL